MTELSNSRSQNQHDPAWTPGPWRTYRTDNAGGPYQEVRIGFNSSECGRPTGFRIAGVDNPYNADLELICLAPEMAEAILHWGEWAEQAGYGGPDEEQIVELAHKLRALSRAEGDTP